MYKIDQSNPRWRAGVFRSHLNRHRSIHHHAHTPSIPSLAIHEKKSARRPRKSRGAIPMLLPLEEACLICNMDESPFALSSPLSSENRPPPSHLPARILGTLPEPSSVSPDAIASSSRHGQLRRGDVLSCCHRHRRCRCFGRQGRDRRCRGKH